MDEPRKGHGALALGLSLGGLVLAVLIGVVAGLVGRNMDVMPAYLLFLGFQIAAFVLGIISRQEALGKAAYITSAVLAVASLLLVR